MESWDSTTSEEGLTKLSARSKRDDKKSRSSGNESRDSSSRSSVSQNQSEVVIKSTCECANCKAWSTSIDWNPVGCLKFSNENKPQKCIVKKDFPPFVKDVKSARNFQTKIIAFSYDNYTKIQKQSISRLVVHSYCPIPKPVEKVSQTYFNADMQAALTSLNYKFSLPLQSFTWPAIFRQLYVFMISAAKTGKTISYLPAMCSFVMQKNEKYEDFEKYKGPIIIILCPNSTICGYIFDLCVKLLAKTRIPVKVSNLSNSMYLSYVDILITTPTVLIECLKSRNFNLKRLCHLIFEDAAHLLETNDDKIYTILQACNEMLEHRHNNQRIQLIVSSRQWSSKLEMLTKRIDMTPLICIGDHIEAAIYSKTQFDLHFTSSNEKMQRLFEILKDTYQLNKTVVVCLNDEILKVDNYLKSKGIDTICLSDKEKDEVLPSEEVWQYSVGGEYQLLLCTDFILNNFLTINDANYLVHYSLISDWTMFTNRFSCMADKYVSPLDSTREHSTKTFLLIDENVDRQMMWKICKLLGRFAARLPDKLKKFIKSCWMDEEKAKLAKPVQLCPMLKLFGECNRFCSKRHILSETVDISHQLPQNGQIVFKIVSLKDVTCYMVQLLKSIDLNGKITEINNDNLFNPIELSSDEKKMKVENVKKSNFYVHCEGNDKFVVCEVVKIEKNSQFVEVKLMPTNQVLVTMPSKLLELPQRIKIVEIYFAHLIPTYNDETFSTRAFSTTFRELTTINYKNLILTGDIRLQLNNTIWVTNIVEKIKVKNVELIKWNLKNVLFDQCKVVELDTKPMNRLYSRCKLSGINLPNYALRQKVVKSAPKKTITPNWAFLNENTFTEVILSSAITPHEFHLRLDKFQSVLENFKLELTKAVKYDILAPNEKLQVEIGGYYIAPDPDKTNYSRVKILNKEDDKVLVFYVDYGDEAVVDVDELRILPLKYITKLPFQAIRCRLHGIDPCDDFDEIWDDQATDILYKYMFEPNDSDVFRLLYAKIVDKKLMGSSNQIEYTILLKDSLGEMKLINNVLIDCGLALSLNSDKLKNFNVPKTENTLEYCDKQDLNSNSDSDNSDIDGFTMEIIDLDSVMKIYLPDVNIEEAKQTNPIKAIEDSKPKIVELDDNNKEIIAKDPPECLTPEVWWSQTKDLIKMRIKLIGVEKYNVQLTRHVVFTFSTDLDGQKYELKFSLKKFARIEKHQAYGQEVVIVLAKLHQSEWEQLTATAKKMRNIHYEPGEHDFAEEKEKLFLTFDTKHSEYKDDTECVYDINDEEELSDFCVAEDNSDEDFEDF